MFNIIRVIFIISIDLYLSQHYYDIPLQLKNIKTH